MFLFECFWDLELLFCFCWGINPPSLAWLGSDICCLWRMREGVEWPNFYADFKLSLLNIHPLPFLWLKIGTLRRLSAAWTVFFTLSPLSPGTSVSAFSALSVPPPPFAFSCLKGCLCELIHLKISSEETEEHTLSSPHW